MSVMSTRFKTYAMIEYLTVENTMPTEIHCPLLAVYIVTSKSFDEAFPKTRMSTSEFDRDNVVAQQRSTTHRAYNNSYPCEIEDRSKSRSASFGLPFLSRIEEDT